MTVRGVVDVVVVDVVIGSRLSMIVTSSWRGTAN